MQENLGHHATLMQAKRDPKMEKIRTLSPLDPTREAYHSTPNEPLVVMVNVLTQIG